jgi:hypothetical protein
MADRSLTLFEVHLHDGVSLSASNRAPFVGGREDSGDDETEIELEEMDDEIEEVDEDVEEMEDELDDLEEELDEVRESSRSLSMIALVLGLIAVAAIVMRMRGGDGMDEMEELDDLADDVVEGDGEEAESEF